MIDRNELLLNIVDDKVKSYVSHEVRHEMLECVVDGEDLKDTCVFTDTLNTIVDKDLEDIGVELLNTRERDSLVKEYERVIEELGYTVNGVEKSSHTVDKMADFVYVIYFDVN